MIGKLFIVATPIGNLNDITYRAIETLKNVDIVLAEDTRHSKKLFAHFEISTPLKAFHEHNEREKTESIISELNSGISAALISDAGTPLISDPGYFLVSQAKKEGIEVVPIPGPSAIITALSASGLASNSFTFFGFLPSKKIARIKYLHNKTTLKETIIFYESPKRILATLKDMLEVFGNERKVCLAKELTKSFETIRTDIIENVIEYLAADLAHQKGEFVILISSADKIDLVDAENQLGEILPILCAEMGASKAAKLAAKITGIDKKHCYNKAIEL
ncbi:16S rRNA (cytidine(1402)-2'-O)-methyltransferase [Candidatus Pseudothioglobus sp. Uisw_016]|uniref:16S rRNA (cytidine(1402)-2'-O)-methyltransferase n=1 Tax=Candidatus Pseudothioglobus sp. Uisw_016 TaxID=3230995 RepID=UPI003A89327E